MTARATTGKSAQVTPMHPPAPEFEVLRLVPRTEPAERVPLFTLPDSKTGKEVEYTIPRDPGSNIGLMYLHIAAGQPCDCTKPHGTGTLAANDYLLNQMLGPAGYKALRECDGLPVADLATIMAIMSRLALGQIEAPKAPATA